MFAMFVIYSFLLCSLVRILARIVSFLSCCVVFFNFFSSSGPAVLLKKFSKQFLVAFLMKADADIMQVQGRLDQKNINPIGTVLSICGGSENNYVY